ncbi:hypothetical protein RJ55_03708 [Drechmeria coniospora]|nr:hypothetical protein RJ55_03708 [Drechmeria coniospora]
MRLFTSELLRRQNEQALPLRRTTAKPRTIGRRMSGSPPTQRGAPSDDSIALLQTTRAGVARFALRAGRLWWVAAGCWPLLAPFICIALHGRLPAFQHRTGHDHDTPPIKLSLLGQEVRMTEPIGLRRSHRHQPPRTNAREPAAPTSRAMLGSTFCSAHDSRFPHPFSKAKWTGPMDDCTTSCSSSIPPLLLPPPAPRWAACQPYRL